MEAALRCWRGPALADVAGQLWASGEIARLEELRLAAIEALFDARLGAGEHELVVAEAEIAVTDEPLRERLWAQLMLALYRSGRQADALRAYQRSRQLLADQLGLEPGRDLAALEAAILAQHPDLSAPPPWSAQHRAGSRRDVEPERRRHNLPAMSSTLIGRESETVEVAKIVRSQRMVTLIGAGGSGKTRLALAVAEGMLDDFSDGVWFVDLAVVTAGGAVAGVVAETLGLRLAGDRPAMDALAEFAATQHRLVVLDNGEHVIADCADVADRLLAAGPEVRILATSREPLRVDGEVIWRVPPLELPDLAGTVNSADIADSESVRLFVERARAAGSDLPLDRLSAATIGRIVVRLDGLPLAIELAAARAGTMDLSELSARLDDRFRLLVGGRRTAAPRQQTLAATLEWSYQLLDPTQQTVLDRLSVFAGSFALGDAEAILCGAGLPAHDIVGHVLDLVDKSLLHLVTGEGDQVRYRLLETVRQFASQRLARYHSEEREWADRHAHHYTAKAHAAGAELTGPRQAAALAALDFDYDNYRQALNRLAANPDGTAELLTAITALRRFWHARGHLHDAIALLTAALTDTEASISLQLRAESLALAAELTGDVDGAVAVSYADTALQVARQLGDDRLTARALSALARLRSKGVDHGAGPAGEQAVALARRSGDLTLLGEALLAYGRGHEHSVNERILEEAVGITRQAGDGLMTAIAMNNLGVICMGTSESRLAADYLRQAQAILDELGAAYVGPALSLGWLSLDDGDIDDAAAKFTVAFQAARLDANTYILALSALGLACCATAESDWRRAAALHAHAVRELEAGSFRWPDTERVFRDHSLARVRDQLGDAFDGLYQEARTMSRAALVDLALPRRPVPSDKHL